MFYSDPHPSTPATPVRPSAGRLIQTLALLLILTLSLIGPRPLQAEPLILTVTTTADDGSQNSLRMILEMTNDSDDPDDPYIIQFHIPGSGPHIINLDAPLPAISSPVTIDGTSQPGFAGTPLIAIRPRAGNTNITNGLTLVAGNTTVRGLDISGFRNHGIEIASNGNNITQNTIAFNGSDGVRVTGGIDNTIMGNITYGNAGLNIDLGGDSVTPNDIGDTDTGPNNLQNAPVLFRATPDTKTGKVTIEGTLNSTPGRSFTLEFFVGSTCSTDNTGEGRVFLGQLPIVTGSQGDVTFTAFATIPSNSDTYVAATVTDSAGNTSEFSNCLPIIAANDVWPRATRLDLTGTSLPGATTEDLLALPGQSRWYKFRVYPHSQAIVTLAAREGAPLPANYDLALYSDIAEAAAQLSADTDQDLLRLGIEFSLTDHNFMQPTPDELNPQQLSPESYTAESFEPRNFSSAVIAPQAFAPQAFAPQAFAPQAFAPDMPSDPEAYTAAQVYSLIVVSALDGTAHEQISINTWNYSGDFYIRVTGRNGVYDPLRHFTLDVSLLANECNSIEPITDAATLAARLGNYRTIILTDMARIAGSSADKQRLQQRLNDLAARAEVRGVVVDIGAEARVRAARVQDDKHPTCPAARNQLADEIKDIIDRYRALNPLEYIVLVGNDDVIPFFRSPDLAPLGPESDYVPPVLDNTTSQASLRLNYVLSQDAYGASHTITSGAAPLPIPDLAVGRLVETPDDILVMLDAYLSTTDGIVSTPTTALVTGYDFLEDTALDVVAELQAGLGEGRTVNTLITPQHEPPTRSWTAAELRSKLLDSGRHDLIFLAGHFSSGSTLAADFRTTLDAAEVAASPTDFTNSIIFSAGCHSGYNVVTDHSIPHVTRKPDWPQAFARKGATLIAGTGYQYGDTEFVAYGEQLYLNFSQQLRTGTGPVAIGQALVAAKQSYLATTPRLQGIDDKTLRIATLFGLPMLRIDMPGARIDPPRPSSAFTLADAEVRTLAALPSGERNPGAILGLSTTDLNLPITLTAHTRTFTRSTNRSETVNVTYLEGPDGVVVNPSAPVLPLAIYDVSRSDTVLRGVGFRGGTFRDIPDTRPLVGAPATEIRGVQVSFPSEVFYPRLPWYLNLFDALVNADQGQTRLVLTPAQFKSNGPNTEIGTLRQFSAMRFRLYYNNNRQSYGQNTPALAAPPAITNIQTDAQAGTITFRATVTGDPAVGIQDVWVTYTATSGPFAGQWQSLDLVQTADSRVWEGQLVLDGTPAASIRYMVQAANGVGLVTLADNAGAYYTPGVDPANSGHTAELQPVTLEIVAPPISGAFGTPITLQARLTSDNGALPNQTITFALGSRRVRASTDQQGQATATLTLLGAPGDYDLSATFAGTHTYAAAFAPPRTFKIMRQDTRLTLAAIESRNRTGTAQSALPLPIAATLHSTDGQPLATRTIFFVISGNDEPVILPIITDFAGRAILDSVPLPPGDYTVTAYFGGTIPLPGEPFTLNDPRYNPVQATGTLTVSPPPRATIWLPIVFRR